MKPVWWWNFIIKLIVNSYRETNILTGVFDNTEFDAFFQVLGTNIINVYLKKLYIVFN